MHPTDTVEQKQAQQYNKLFKEMYESPIYAKSGRSVGFQVTAKPASNEGCSGE